MKKLIYIALAWTLMACNPDGAGCFTSSGPTATAAFTVAGFKGIDISSNIEVRLTVGTNYSVQVTTGSNLMAGIRAEVVDSILYLDNLNSCNWTRKYVNPVVEITTPRLELLTLRGSGNVISTGILSLDKLKLENLEGSGDFHLEVNSNSLNIVTNSLANFYIKGNVQQLDLWFYWNDGIFFGQELQANDCKITHYGSNTLHINVLDSLYGGIYSFGNVVMHRQMPARVNMVEEAEGRLIFAP